MSEKAECKLDDYDQIINLSNLTANDKTEKSKDLNAENSKLHHDDLCFDINRENMITNGDDVTFDKENKEQVIEDEKKYLFNDKSKQNLRHSESDKINDNVGGASDTLVTSGSTQDDIEPENSFIHSNDQTLLTNSSLFSNLTDGNDEFINRRNEQVSEYSASERGDNKGKASTSYLEPVDRNPVSSDIESTSSLLASHHQTFKYNISDRKDVTENEFTDIAHASKDNEMNVVACQDNHTEDFLHGKKTEDLTSTCSHNLKLVHAKLIHIKLDENETKSDEKFDINTKNVNGTLITDTRGNPEENNETRRPNILTSESTIPCQVPEENNDEIPKPENHDTDGDVASLRSGEQMNTPCFRPNTLDKRDKASYSILHEVPQQMLTTDGGYSNGKTGAKDGHLDRLAFDTCNANGIEAVSCHDHIENIPQDMTELDEDSKSRTERNIKQLFPLNTSLTLEVHKADKLTGNSLDSFQIIETKKKSREIGGLETKSIEQIDTNPTMLVCKNSADERGSLTSEYTSEGKNENPRVNILTIKSSISCQMPEKNNEINDEIPKPENHDTDGNVSSLESGEQMNNPCFRPNTLDEGDTTSNSILHEVPHQMFKTDGGYFNGKPGAEDGHLDTTPLFDTCNANGIEAVACNDHIETIPQDMTEQDENSKSRTERNIKQLYPLNTSPTLEVHKADKLTGKSLDSFQTIETKKKSREIGGHETKSIEQLDTNSTMLVCKNSAVERGSLTSENISEEKNKKSRVNILTIKSSISCQMPEENNEINDEIPKPGNHDTDGDVTSLESGEQMNTPCFRPNTLDEGDKASFSILHEVPHQMFKNDGGYSNGKTGAEAGHLDIPLFDTCNANGIEAVSCHDHIENIHQDMTEQDEDSKSRTERNIKQVYPLNTSPTLEVNKADKLTGNSLDNFQTIETKKKSREIGGHETKSIEQIDTNSTMLVFKDGTEERGSLTSEYSSEEKNKNRRVNILTKKSSISCQMPEENNDINEEIPKPGNHDTDGNVASLESGEQMNTQWFRSYTLDEGDTTINSILHEVPHHMLENDDGYSNGKSGPEDGQLDIPLFDTCNANGIEAVSCHDHIENISQDMTKQDEDSKSMIERNVNQFHPLNTSPTLEVNKAEELVGNSLDNLETTETKKKSRRNAGHETKYIEHLDTNSTILVCKDNANERGSLTGEYTSEEKSNTLGKNSKCAATTETHKVFHHTREKSDRSSSCKTITCNDYSETLQTNTSEVSVKETAPSIEVEDDVKENITEHKVDVDSGNIIADYDASSKARSRAIVNVGHGKIKSTIFNFFHRGSKKREKEASALLPDNSNSDAVLANYRKIQTDLSTNNDGKQLERRDVKKIKNKNDFQASQKFRKQGNIVDFGKRCEDCITKSVEDLKPDEIRCLKCFHFECLLCKTQCVCQSVCYCKTLGNTIKDKLEEVKKALREKINSRLPNEDTIYTVSTHCFILHNGKTTVTVSLKLIKQFETQDKKVSTQSQGNFIEVLILDYDRSPPRKHLSSRQAVRVTLKTIVDEKVIGVYESVKSTRTDKFIIPLSKYLGGRNIHTKDVKTFSGKIDKKEAQLIVVCQIHSRAFSDVNVALDGIEEKFYKQVILVLLHFKYQDKRKCATELKSNERYAEMSIIDLFQQPENNNAEDVFRKIVEAII